MGRIISLARMWLTRSIRSFYFSSEYVEALLKEIKMVGEMNNGEKKRVSSLYFEEERQYFYPTI